MSNFRTSKVAFCALCFALLVTCDAAAQHAAEVVSYTPGSTADSNYNSPAAALGSPERFTGEGIFPGAVTPFNPPWRTDELVSVGEGGQITLKLSNYVVPRNSGPEIGVFENVGFIYNSVNGGTFPGPATFGEDPAFVEVSADGIAWASLGEVLFNIPSNGYADSADAFATVPGSIDANFRQPFTGSLSDFDNKTWPEVLDVLDGSGGGTWIDISATGLPYVGYIRFSVASDGISNTSLNFELDGVSIADGAMSGVVPEPASIVILSGFAAAALALFPRWLRRATLGGLDPTQATLKGL